MAARDRDIRPAGPILVAHLFPGERDALLCVLDDLSDDEWAAPTVCAGWSVHDVALHLLGDDIGIISRRRDGYRQAAAPGMDLSRWDQLVTFINEQNALWVEATRRISPRLLCDFLRMTGEATAAHFAGINPYALGGPVNWAGPEPAPIWLDTAREYTERWVHQQHIRDAVGRPGLNEPHWLAPVLDTFVRALPYTLRDVAAPDGMALRLVITGAAGGTWSAVRTQEAWLLTTDTITKADATVTLDQETAWRLWTKGLDQADASERVRRDGNRTLASTVLKMVSIIA